MFTMLLEENYRFHARENITFTHALYIYRDIICRGPNLLNVYTLDASNHSKDITLSMDFHIDSPLVTITQKGHIQDIGELTAFLSRDSLEKNAPGLRYIKDHRSFQTIKYEPVESLIAYKQPIIVPILGDLFNTRMPFVSVNEVRIKEESPGACIYEIFLMSNRKEELRLMKANLVGILLADAKALHAGFFPG